MIVFQNGQLLLQISTLYSSSLKHLSMKREKCYDNETDKNGYLIIMRQKTPTSVWKSYNLLVWGLITLIWPKSRGPVSHKHTPCSHLTATPSHLNRHRIWESALLVTLPFLRDQAINATSKNLPTLGHSLQSVPFWKQLKFWILRCNSQETGIWVNALNILSPVQKGLAFLKSRN